MKSTVKEDTPSVESLSSTSMQKSLMDEDDISSLYSADPSSLRLHSIVIGNALSTIFKTYSSDWQLLSGWPRKTNGRLSHNGNYIIVNQSTNHFSLVAINVVSCDETYYIHLCGLSSKLGHNEKKLLKCFKNITPRHVVDQEFHNSCCYHVILFTMLLVTHGIDLQTVSYSILNNKQFHLTESILTQLQNWLVNESLLPLHHAKTGEIIGHKDYDCDNDFLVMSQFYKPDSI